MAVRRPRFAQATAGHLEQLPAPLTLGRSRAWNYLLAGLGVAAVTALRAAIDPFVGTADPALTIFVFLVGVGIAGILRGVECALVSLLIGGGAAWFLYLGPMYRMTLLDPTVLVGIALYVQTGVGIAFLTGGQHRSHLIARAAAAEAAARSEELTRERAARERAENALRGLEDRVAGVAEIGRTRQAILLAHEAAGLGTWDHDLVSGAMEWDARAKALFGVTPDVAMTRAMWAAAVHPPDLPNAEALQDLAIRERKPFSAEYRVLWPDGSIHWITAVGRATFDGANGKPLRLTGVMLDGTDRKKEEERLSEVLRLEAIGRLAGGVAHDLNNMLVAILGYSELLGRTLDTDDPRRRDVDQITEAATRSAKLTRQLLAFARRELIQPQRLELNRVVERSEPSLRSVLDAAGIELAFQLSPNAGIIYADPSQVEQVIMNLVLNARDAITNGGRITVETGPGPDRHVMLAVRDTGHGMDPTILRRIWEPFFTTKPAGRGAGLGLAAVHGAVKQSGGFVGAESQPNRGTVVSVYWPEVQIEPT
ncbi:MAG TPA: ATP-binding protein [Gemmatimonadales bacterium]|nr:ATP-binding protein [Gemmatimonadales bacterium]